MTISVVSAIAIYFVIWWTVLFAVLPFGVRTQADDGDVVSGSDPGAPVKPLLLRKVLATTVVATIVYGILYLLWRNGVTFDDIPFLPRFG